MAGIYWSEGEAQVKDYSALTKAGSTTITIKLVVTDHYSLGHILETLDRATKKPKPAPLSRRGQQLLLTDQRGQPE